MLGRRLGSENRQRGELGGGGLAEAEGTRAPAIVRLGLINKRLGGAFLVHKEGLKSLRGRGRRLEGGSHRAAPMAERRGSGLVRVRSRSGRGRVFMGAGGRLGSREVTMTTRARLERSRYGRRRAPLWRPMARHGQCAGRWIYKTWRGPLATDGTGVLPPAQRSDQLSLRHLGMRARRGYGAYGGLPTWPRTTSRRGASQSFPGVYSRNRAGTSCQVGQFSASINSKPTT
jgi:hypothetical protein